ncbi:MAG: pilus assembly protein [Cyanobacteria bacterium SZAS LIN-2]|nr:pilus assembly protein [Cyanobacteria bacterium SZAS LIN-2]
MNISKTLKRLGKATRRGTQEESGSALVEFAISSIIILGTFISVFQVSMACYHYNTVAEVTRDTARWAAVRGSSCSTNTPTMDNCNASKATIQNYATTVGALNWSQCTTANPCITVSYKAASTVTSSSTYNTTTTWSACSSGTCNAPGNMVTVSMNYPYTLNLPFFRNYSINLGSTSTMIVAQ